MISSCKKAGRRICNPLCCLALCAGNKRGRRKAMTGASNIGGFYLFLSFFFSLNNQSFWIDECCTALCAMQQGMEGCWKKICEIGGSDAQMAFYYYLLFLWHHLTGAESEWMLRLFNIFWVFLSSWFFRKESKALVILLISPFFCLLF